ncbi:hypothetical protein SK128_018755 [Halocaridina rubra]|uniref:Uncharacterized protein n=1 Tax=Halocaridina rubra TaxID=373956 RepID=A0AAN8ZSS3_HALRR
MFERVNGVFGCRTRLSNVFDNQIPRSHVRTSLQTLVCQTAFDEPFYRAIPLKCLKERGYTRKSEKGRGEIGKTEKRGDTRKSEEAEEKWGRVRGDGTQGRVRRPRRNREE